MPPYQLFLFGSPRLEQHRRPIRLHGRKALALAGYLAVTAQPQRRDWLATLFWPEFDQTAARANLRRELSQLRRVLGDEQIQVEGDEITMPLGPEAWTDVALFQAHLAECRQHDHNVQTVCPACLPRLQAAADLYTADFLAGFTLADCPAFDEWQFFQAEGYRQKLATVLDRLVQGYRDATELTAAITVARRRVSLDPLHEPAQRQLIALYAETNNMAAALRQYELCVQLLRDEVGVPPDEETVALYKRLRQEKGDRLHKTQPDRLVAPREQRHNLPAQTTPLIGRKTEVTELVRLCQDETVRLVTILGPGGMGKSRVAIEVAQTQVEYIPHGVFFVALAALTTVDQIIPAIAEAIAFQFQADRRPPQQQLFDYLREKQILLLLDNFEHLLTGVGLVQALLEASSGLTLLLTSRERLRLSSETVFALGTLDYPTWTTSKATLDYDAVKLFVQAARRSRPDFHLSTANEAAVTRICQLVGGMPLGIILAAAWVEVLTPAEIADELAQGVDWLATELHDLPQRQRSMTAVLTYSWQHMTVEEQAVLMQLAFFRGGFTRAAAQAVAGAGLSMLARLVEKSLVQRRVDGRYDIHELVRQFAVQQLRVAGAYDGLQAAHGAYYLNFLHDCTEPLAGATQLAVIFQIEADFENLQAAWVWAVQTDNAALVDRALDGLFRWFWLRRTRQQDGLALLHVAWQRWASDENLRPIGGRILARLLEQSGPWLLEPAVVQQRLTQALACAQQQANQREITFCTWALGLAIVSEHREDEQRLQSALQSYETSIAAYRANGDHFWLAQALENLGHVYRQLDQWERAVLLLQESLALRRAQGDRFGMARSLRELAFARLNQGWEQETLVAAQAAYELQRELGDQQGIADSRFFLALALLCQGDWQQAQGLFYPVQHFADERNNALYRTWAARGLTIAACMEQNIQQRQAHSCSFPNGFSVFTTKVYYVLFNPITSTAYQHRVHNLGLQATTARERALYALFTANLAVHQGDLRYAAQQIALAFSEPAVAESWVCQLPEMVAMQQALKEAQRML